MIANHSVNYQFRTATMRDAVTLQESCWPDKSLDAVRVLVQRVEILSRRGRGFGIVAESGRAIDRRIIGYAQLTIWPRVAEISDLIVAPAFRDMGIGTALIHYLIEKARIWPMSHVEIGVARSNPRAYALYQRLGFNEDRTITLDIGGGPEEVTYLKLPLATR
jgi:ribosomal protein S18 acetylase RimI-like enzyme